MNAKHVLALTVVCVASVAASTAMAGPIDVTEWSYQGTNGEFVELTNTSSAAVDMTGWSFNDDHAVASTTDPTNPAIDLSAFGTVQPGESVIIVGDGATITPEAFRTAWSLSAAVKILSAGSIGLGRNDAIKLYSASGTNIETFAFGDQNYAGTVRTQNVSANILPADLASAAALASMPKSVVGDALGSFASTGGDVGNPGTYIVPEPTTLGAVAGVATLVVRRRSRR